MTSALLMGIDKVPDQSGYFVLNHEGAVLSSAGDLENDEKVASDVTDVVRYALKVPVSDNPEEKLKRITLSYKDFHLLITISNQKIFVVKRPNKIDS